MMKLTTYTELEIGHRLMTSYAQRCRHFHGHRYEVEITLGSKELNPDGMVIDFKKLKEIVKQQLDDLWDHGFALHKDDPMVAALGRDKETDRFHILPENPTLEYMVKLWFGDIKQALETLKEKHPESIAADAKLLSIKASETSKNTCEYSED